MIRKYDVVAENDQLWNVYETATGQIMGVFGNPKAADYHRHQLDRGIGFDGWTPPFILTKVVPKDELNRQFTEFLSATP